MFGYRARGIVTSNSINFREWSGSHIVVMFFIKFEHCIL